MNYLEFILTIIGGALATISGVYLSNWFKRPKPWLGLSSVDRDDASLVEIPRELIPVSDECHWCSELNDKVTLHSLKEFIQNIQESVETIKEKTRKLNVINNLINKTNRSDEDKLDVLRILLADNIIRQIIQGNLRRGFIQPEINKSNSFEELLKIEEVLENPDTKEKAIILYNQKEKFLIKVGDGYVPQNDIEKTRNLVTVLNRFIVDEIKTIADVIKSELQTDLQHCLTLDSGLQELLKSRRLKIKAKLSNIGSKPIHIKPYGLLKIKTGGEKKVSPLIIKVESYRLNEVGMEEFPRMVQLIEGLASKQGVVSSRTPYKLNDVSEYIIVNPGNLVEIELTTLDTTLEDSAIRALEEGMLSSKVILVRADTKKIIESEFQTVGIGLGENDREELLKLAE